MSVVHELVASWRYAMAGQCDPAVLLRACRRGDVHLIQTLQRRYGTESLLRVRDFRGATCLHHAARGGHLAVLRQLTVWASGTAPRTLVGATPLHDTAVIGQLGALKWLLQHTACSLRDTDLEGCTVLHLAARYESALTLWAVPERFSSDVLIMQKELQVATFSGPKVRISLLLWPTVFHFEICCFPQSHSVVMLE